MQDFAFTYQKNFRAPLGSARANDIYAKSWIRACAVSPPYRIFVLEYNYLIVLEGLVCLDDWNFYIPIKTAKPDRLQVKRPDNEQLIITFMRGRKGYWETRRIVAGEWDEGREKGK